MDGSYLSGIWATRVRAQLLASPLEPPPRYPCLSSLCRMQDDTSLSGAKSSLRKISLKLEADTIKARCSRTPAPSGSSTLAPDAAHGSRQRISNS